MMIDEQHAESHMLSQPLMGSVVGLALVPTLVTQASIDGGRSYT